MKNIFQAAIAFILFLYVNSAQASQEIRLAFDDRNNFPYYIDDSTEVNQKQPGLAVEAIKQLEKYHDIRLKILRFPWKRCFAQMEAGDIDGVFIASFEESRKQFGRYPMKNDQVDSNRRVTTITYVMYVPLDSQVEWDGNKFKNLNGPVGVTLGYSIGEYLKKMGVDISENDKIYNDFSKLKLKRLVGVAALENSADFVLQQHQDTLTEIVKLKPPLITKAYYLMFSHQFAEKNPQLVEQLWNTIKIIRESAAMKSIEASYFKELK